MSRTVVVLSLIYFSSLILTYKQNDYKLKHEYAKIDYYNRSYLEFVTVKNVKPNRTYRAYSIFGRILMDLEGDTFKGNVKAFKFINNQYHHKLIDFDVKICDGLKANYFGITNLLRTSNITKCPIRKGYYTINNFNVDESKFPPFIPAGRYRLQLSALDDGYTIVQASAFIEVVYKIGNM